MPTGGGGFTVSRGLTSYGLAAERAQIRGAGGGTRSGSSSGYWLVRWDRWCLGRLRPSCGNCREARRVLESNFPDVIHVTNVEEVDEEMVMDWALQHSGAGVVLIVAGLARECPALMWIDCRGAQREPVVCACPTRQGPH